MNGFAPARLPALLVALAAATSLSAALAAEAYLFNVMKEPAYRKAYDAMLAGAEHLPDWLDQITGRGNYVATPETDASIGGVTYRLFHACKAHDCSGHALEVMFTPDARKAFGLLIDAKHPQRWFGSPDADQRGALRKAMGK